MIKYRKPGVYIKALSSLPQSVAQVETAIPAFIGYTEKGPDEPIRISSIGDFKTIFGGPNNELDPFVVDERGDVTSPEIAVTPDFRLYYMLEMFFANGGGDCYIIRVGGYGDGISNSEMQDGLNLLEKEDVPTLILFPDAASPKNINEPYDLFNSALDQCAAGNDRFLICDVKESDTEINPVWEAAFAFRYGIGSNNLMFGAAYYPDLITTLGYHYDESEINITLNGNSNWVLRNNSDPDKSLYHTENGKYRDAYNRIKSKIESVRLVLPPSGAIAGIYARVDRSRGVWKAPANVSLNRVSAPNVNIDHNEQQDLNVTQSGKSINAIREFKERGVMVWGARTLAGNDNEWRFIPVRRFFNMVETSVKNAIGRFVFEPNDANTWVKIKTMIENYLTTLWRSGALRGTTPNEAFFVKVGLGETMSQDDVLNDKLIVEIGMAAVRPAEFIIFRFSQKMMKS